MTEIGFWKSLGVTLAQVVAPTKSDDEIKLTQQAREAKAGDELAKALESLSERDTSKVNAGMTLLNALKTNTTVEVKNEQPKQGKS